MKNYDSLFGGKIGFAFCFFLCGIFCFWAGICQEPYKTAEPLHRSEKNNHFVPSQILSSVDNNRITNTNSDVTVKPAILNFGKVLEGKDVESSFFIHNNSSKRVIVSEIKTTCNCTSPTIPQGAFLPYTSQKIPIKVHTSGKHGQNRGIVLVRWHYQHESEIFSIPIQTHIDILTPGKLVTVPSNISLDNVKPKSKIKFQLQLKRVSMEPLPSVQKIDLPEWLQVSVYYNYPDFIEMTFEGIVPNISGHLENTICIVNDNPYYQTNDILLSINVVGDITFEKPYFIKVVSLDKLPMTFRHNIVFNSKVEKVNCTFEGLDKIQTSIWATKDDSDIWSIKMQIHEINLFSEKIIRGKVVISAEINGDIQMSKLPLLLIIKDQE